MNFIRDCLNTCILFKKLYTSKTLKIDILNIMNELSVELLQYIFEFVDSHFRINTLQRVSKLWKSVIHNSDTLSLDAIDLPYSWKNNMDTRILYFKELRSLELCNFKHHLNDAVSSLILYFNNIKFTKQIKPILSHSLEALDFSNSSISDFSFILNNFPNLKILILSGCPHLSFTDYTSLEPHMSLVSLDISRTSLSDNQLRSLFKRVPNLIQLSLASTKFSFPDKPDSSLIPDPKPSLPSKLKILDISKCPNIPHRSLQSVLDHSPQLHRLISRNTPSERHARAPLVLSHLRLAALDISNSFFTHLHVRLPSLTELNLKGTAISDQNFSLILKEAWEANLSNLEDINISDCFELKSPQLPDFKQYKHQINNKKNTSFEYNSQQSSNGDVVYKDISSKKMNFDDNFQDPVSFQHTRIVSEILLSLSCTLTQKLHRFRAFASPSLLSTADYHRPSFASELCTNSIPSPFSLPPPLPFLRTVSSTSRKPLQLTVFRAAQCSLNHVFLSRLLSWSSPHLRTLDISCISGFDRLFLTQIRRQASLSSFSRQVILSNDASALGQKMISEEERAQPQFPVRKNSCTSNIFHEANVFSDLYPPCELLEQHDSSQAQPLWKSKPPPPLSFLEPCSPSNVRDSQADNNVCLDTEERLNPLTSTTRASTNYAPSSRNDVNQFPLDFQLNLVSCMNNGFEDDEQIKKESSSLSSIKRISACHSMLPFHCPSELLQQKGLSSQEISTKCVSNEITSNRLADDCPLLSKSSSEAKAYTQLLLDIHTMQLNLSSLKEINLSFTLIPDDEISTILRFASNLSHLKLRDSCGIVSPNWSSNSLKTLEVSGTAIDNNQVTNIVQNCPNLIFLDASRCMRIRGSVCLVEEYKKGTPGPKLKKVIFSGCLGLKLVDCRFTLSLKDIDVSGCTTLHQQYVKVIVAAGSGGLRIKSGKLVRV